MMINLGDFQNVAFAKENQILTPLALRGIAAWWDMADEDTVHESAGGIERVDDKGPDGIDLIQTNSSFRGSYSTGDIKTGVKNLLLNGSTDYMTADGLAATGITTKPYSCFVVFKAASGGGTYGNCVMSFNTSGNNGDSVFALSAAIECYYWNAAGSSRTGFTSIAGNKIGQAVLLSNNSGIQNTKAGFAINTASNKTETSNFITNWVGYSRNQFSVGMEYDVAVPSDYFDGAIGEIIFSNRGFSGYETILLINYAAKKWGIT